MGPQKSETFCSEDSSEALKHMKHGLKWNREPKCA